MSIIKDDGSAPPLLSIVTVQQLRQAMPNCPRAEVYAPALAKSLSYWSILDRQSVAVLLAQVAHETGDLALWTELSDGRAYEGAARLGNTRPGDGPRFKGRGPAQLTGRRNYGLCGDAIGIDLLANPERLLEPAVGFDSLGWFYRRGAGCNLSRAAIKRLGPHLVAPRDPDGSVLDLDAVARAGDLVGVTWAWNGGQNGAADRLRRYALARAAMGLPAQV